MGGNVGSGRWASKKAPEPLIRSQQAQSIASEKAMHRGAIQEKFRYTILRGFSEYRSGCCSSCFCRNMVKIRGSLNGTEECSKVFECIGPHCERKSSERAFKEVLGGRRVKRSRGLPYRPKEVPKFPNGRRIPPYDWKFPMA